MINYRKQLNQTYKGKTITRQIPDTFDYDWIDDDITDEDFTGGSCCIEIQSRKDYIIYDSIEEDCEEESEQWKVSTSLSIEVNEDKTITGIDINADVYCYGDSGLGDIDPDDVWEHEDYQLACDVLNAITE